MNANTIIIGAGIAGLTAAIQLQAHELPYMLLEQSAVVGGRLATLSIGENGRADYGTQFFTAQSPEFQAQVQRWQDDHLAFEWSTQWSDGSLKRSHVDGKPRYAIHGGMAQLAQHLARGLDSIYLNHTVTGIQWHQGQWQIEFADDTFAVGDYLMMTVPVPLALSLLLDVPLSPRVRQTLQRIHYPPGLSGVFIIDGETTLPESGGLQLADDIPVIQWIVDNDAKGLPSDERVITVQTKRLWSKQHFDRDDDEILREMQAALQAYLPDDTVITKRVLKRWQYSVPLTTYPHPILMDSVLPLMFVGDAFGGYGRVEGAYLSGLAAGQNRVEQMQPGDSNTTSTSQVVL